MSARRRLSWVKQRPATFVEAGVAGPFTTPALAQAWLRVDHRGRIEVVARNPTGADGMYVLPLKAATELFRLSIHDRAMVERLETIQPISPLSIRKVALDLALEGWRHLIALWQSVAEQSREVQRDVMVELGELVPLVPLVADEWLGTVSERHPPRYRLHRHVRLMEDWRSGLMIERQAALEQVQAASF